MSSILIDLTPLRLHADFRRLYIGTALSAVGAQLASTAIALQVYDLTSSSFAVGLVGLFGLIPLVALGLYGGAIVDAFDRKKVALASALLIWVTGMLNTLQAALGNTHAWVLYALVALNSAAFAINSPARQAIYPRILPAAQLPAANALFSLEMSLAMLIGPTLAGFLVQHGGYVITYGLDAALFVFALWGLAGLPAVPTSGERKVPGLRSVVEGLGYLAGRPNLRMTFFTDFCAMILANPRALFPAVAALVLGGGSLTVGYLNSALAAGAMVAALLSGYLPRVVFQGRAVVGAVTSWGAGDRRVRRGGGAHTRRHDLPHRRTCAGACGARVGRRVRLRVHGVPQHDHAGLRRRRVPRPAAGRVHRGRCRRAAARRAGGRRARRMEPSLGGSRGRGCVRGRSAGPGRHPARLPALRRPPPHAVSNIRPAGLTGRIVLIKHGVGALTGRILLIYEQKPPANSL